MTDTMKLWDSVSKTNPEFTKEVEFGRKFTAIDAHSQIMEATRAFGPVGQGWGYSASAPIFQEGLVFVPVTIWHGDRSNVFGPMTGGAEWKTVKGRIDSDAVKKATTDALTKLLSHIGFNADVFLKKFDDNKYVEEMKREFAPKPDLLSEQQCSEIIAMAQGAGVNLGPILKHFSCSKIQEVEASRYDAIIKGLKEKLAANHEQKDAT